MTDEHGFLPEGWAARGGLSSAKIALLIPKENCLALQICYAFLHDSSR
ncbi:MAG: hypothetical protein JSR45_13030 [Proteobacteria bacterium]|nr:hypothetical protein [Pseudomonadota bacterium]